MSYFGIFRFQTALDTFYFTKKYLLSRPHDLSVKIIVLVPVVQRLDNASQRINREPLDKNYQNLSSLPQWIVICSEDSAFPTWNNWGLDCLTKSFPVRLSTRLRLQYILHKKRKVRFPSDMVGPPYKWDFSTARSLMGNTRR